MKFKLVWSEQKPKPTEPNTLGNSVSVYGFYCYQLNVGIVISTFKFRPSGDSGYHHITDSEQIVYGVKQDVIRQTIKTVDELDVDVAIADIARKNNIIL